MFICVGLFTRNAQAAQGMSLLVFPLAFVSSAYVPVESMPGWLQAVAAHQPVTPMVDAVRALTIGPVAGQTTAHLVVAALVWAAGLVAVFGPVAVALFRRT
jgi:ABC-2 type transport system permease protein